MSEKMTEMPTDDDLLAQLLRFGPPLFVPTGPWWVAGIEHSDGVPDGVLVLGGEGAIEIRTELDRGLTPISISVRNVQGATVNSPDPEVRARWNRVIVEETDREVWLDELLVSVRVLRSYACFSFETVVENRIVKVAGEIDALNGLRIERMDELTLRSKDRC